MKSLSDAEDTKSTKNISRNSGSIRRSFHRHGVGYVCHVLWSGLVLFVVIGWSFTQWYKDQPWQDQIQQIIEYKPPQSTRFYDQSSRLISESYGAHREYTSLKDIPTTLIDAVLAIEDQSFYAHSGVDFKAIIRAALHNILALKVIQGGSTITQQVVRSHLLSREKTFQRKFKEVMLAWHLERAISKQKILEMYLNHLFLGQNAYGVSSIAKRLFSASLKDLGVHEHALIAGLFQAPSRYNPFRDKKQARIRQIQVLKAMKSSRKISAESYRSWIKKPLRYRFHPGQTFTSHHMYTIDYARREAEAILNEKDLRDKGYEIYTTLNPAVSDTAARAVKQMDPTFTKLERMNKATLGDEKIEVAVMVMNIRSGEIEAVIGGRNYAQSRFNRSIQAKRSPGSLFKPVIYSFALLHGYRWSDVFYLSPITVDDTYRPRSSESEYLKETTLLRAFTSSINVTTVEVGKKLGFDRIAEHARKLGITSPIKSEYGSLIGQSEVGQLDMLRMYSTFANQGQMIEPTVISHIVDHHGEVVYRAPPREQRQTQVLPEAINFLMVKAMSSVLRYGTARSAYHLAHRAAGKTGTSNDSVDNWFCGFTSDYVVVVWVGPETPKPLLRGRVAGATLALPIWTSIIESVSAGRVAGSFAPPVGVRSFTIDGRYGHKVDRGYEAWFLAHHAPPSSPSYLKLIEMHKRLRGFGAYR